MGPTWDPPGSCRPQMGPMMAPWTLLSGMSYVLRRKAWIGTRFVAALCLPYRFSTWPLRWITDSPGHPWLIASENDDWWIWFIACFCLVGFCLGQTGSERNWNTVKLTRETHAVLLGFILSSSFKSTSWCLVNYLAVFVWFVSQALKH